jgi:hypothetical protein
MGGSATKLDFSDPEPAGRCRVLADYVEAHPRDVKKRGSINLHVHTNESYSFFSSPTEAVWYAYREGLEYFGINDHYTIAGHDEFRAACEIASIKPTFSVEAIAIDEESQRLGRRYNDPDNPGRCYLVGKGVTKDLIPGSRGFRTLETMRRSIRDRNRRIVEKLNDYCTERGVTVGLQYREVERLTPRGNTTERHVVQAFCEKMQRLYPDVDELAARYSGLLGDSMEESLLSNPVKLQARVRERLVKSGMPCFVEEDKNAFTSIEDLVDLYLEYGSIPIYPLMGNPITEEEEDLDALFVMMRRCRLNALEIIDYRTKIERAAQIIDAASTEGYPVFIGTEHNTKEEISLRGPVAEHPEFYAYLRRSGNFVIGHQRLMGFCDYGYVFPDGSPRFDDRQFGFRFFEIIGEMDIPAPQLEELGRMSVEERRGYFGI